MLAYDWPGNIRELRNAWSAPVVLSEGEIITCTTCRTSCGPSMWKASPPHRSGRRWTTTNGIYPPEHDGEQGEQGSGSGPARHRLATLYRKLKKLRIETP